MKRAVWIFVVVVLFSSFAHSSPGDYALRIKGGPSFNISDWKDQIRLGGEFDYSFGYSLGFDLMTMLGISNAFHFTLIPSLRFDYLYIGQAYFYGVLGFGYGVYDKDSALDIRMGTGISIPLGDQFEFNTDVNMFIAAGTQRTPVTLDWLMALGFRFH